MRCRIFTQTEENFGVLENSSIIHKESSNTLRHFSSIIFCSVYVFIFLFHSYLIFELNSVQDEERKNRFFFEFQEPLPSLIFLIFLNLFVL